MLGHEASNERDTNQKEKGVTKEIVHTDAGADSAHVCPQCGKQFAQKRRLIKHMVTWTHIGHADRLLRHGEKRYTCNVCGASFTQNADLKQHQLTHTDEMRCRCQYCGKLFRTKATLTHHVRIHTGEKPYSCDWCGKMFADSSTRMKHKSAKRCISTITKATLK